MPALLGEYKKTKTLAKDIVVDVTIALTNMISLLNPEKIVIGGKGATDFMEMMLDICEFNQHFAPLRTNIELASLGGNAAAIGVVKYMLDHHFLTILK